MVVGKGVRNHNQSKLNKYKMGIHATCLAKKDDSFMEKIFLLRYFNRSIKTVLESSGFEQRLGMGVFTTQTILGWESLQPGHDVSIIETENLFEGGNWAVAAQERMCIF